jgi:uncharacterized protein (TIGR02246 family)
MTTPHIEDTTDHTPDVAAIRGVNADAETAFNAADADLLVEHVAANVTAVGVTGARVAGRAAMLVASRAAFDGPLRGHRARYDIADITFVRPDVALVHKEARPVDERGAPVDAGHGMTALYVLVRESGRWRVVARQNTLLPSPTGSR